MASTELETGEGGHRRTLCQLWCSLCPHPCVLPDGFLEVVMLNGVLKDE